MVKQNKSRRLREKMRDDIMRSKQSTLGTFSATRTTEPSKPVAPEPKKQIEITDIGSSIAEDELILRIGFRLVPSRTRFSRITSDLFFDGQRVETLHLRVLQGPLATDESEFSVVLSMMGISAGKHVLRVELYELWTAGEKRTGAVKEATVEYVPLKREDRLIRIPLVKSVEGAGLDILTESEKRVYSEVKEDMKRELEGRRDHW